MGPTQLAYAFFYATYGSEHWPAFWQALADGLGGDVRGLAAMARSFDDLASYAPFALVTCLDAPHAAGGGGLAGRRPPRGPHLTPLRRHPLQRAAPLRLLAAVPLRAPPGRGPGHAADPRHGQHG